MAIGERMVTLGPWPRGIDNRHADPSLPKDTLREAINLDIDTAGSLHVRSGYTRRLTTTSRARSLFSHAAALWFAQGAELRRWAPGDVASTLALAGVHATDDIASIDVNGERYLSDGVLTARISASGSVGPWGTPLPPSGPALAAGAGRLPAGQYLVVLTQVSASGEESGTTTLASITVAENSAIVLSGIQHSAGMPYIKVYCTNPNGTALLAHGLASASESTYTISAPPVGRPCETLGMIPFPPCKVLAYLGGKILGANGPILYKSQALRYGLMLPRTDFLMFPADVTLIAPMDDGLYLGTTDKTYWLGGKGVGDGELLERLPVGAVRGTLYQEAIGRGAYWMSPLGMVKGENSGGLKLLTETRYTPGSYAAGAATIIEQDGQRRVVQSLTSRREGSSFAVTDYAEAEVIRRTPAA